jgi:hypothetical protein
MTKPTRKREKAKLPTGRCPAHAHYTGVRKPDGSCEYCMQVWERANAAEESYFEAMKERTTNAHIAPR